MESVYAEISNILEELRSALGIDFAAAARVQKSDQTLRWIQVLGNRNERYKRIFSPIKGMCGKVVRSGRPMIIPSFAPKSGDDPGEYPLFVAENLHSMMIAPLGGNDDVHGILLVGCRKHRHFTEEELDLLLHLSEQLNMLTDTKSEHLNTRHT